MESHTQDYFAIERLAIDWQWGGNGVSLQVLVGQGLHQTGTWQEHSFWRAANWPSIMAGLVVRGEVASRGSLWKSMAKRPEKRHICCPVLRHSQVPLSSPPSPYSSGNFMKHCSPVSVEIWGINTAACVHCHRINTKTTKKPYFAV